MVLKYFSSRFRHVRVSRFLRMPSGRPQVTKLHNSTQQDFGSLKYFSAAVRKNRFYSDRSDISGQRAAAAYLALVVSPLVVLFFYSVVFEVDSEVMADVNDWLNYRPMDSVHTPWVTSDPHLAPGHIRLLTLEAGADNEILSCHLWTIPIKDTTQLAQYRYEAISYFWGDPTPRCIIICNGSQKKIPVNAYKALRHLQYTDRSLCIWMDNICIDQQNIEERTSQIKLMPHIYHHAARVVIWIGEQDDVIDHCFDLLRESKLPSALSIRRIWRRDFTWARVGIKPEWRTSRVNFSETDWRLLDKMLRRPWFRRGWVIQEVAFARRAIIVCGRNSLDWRYLASMIRDLSYTGLAAEYLSGDAQSSAHNVLEMETIRKKISQQISRPLFTVLLATNFTQCSDIRDKVFAILSLTTESDLPQAGYHMSATTVFTLFAKWQIQHKQNLYFLSCTVDETKPAGYDLEQLPSWVPDWTRIENCHPFVRYVHRIPFPAIDPSQSYLFAPMEAVVEGEALILQGSLLGIVEKTGDIPKFAKTPLFRTLDHKSLQALQSNKKWVRDCLSILKPLLLSVDDTWSFMTCKLTGEGFLAPPSFRKRFEEYLAFLQSVPDELPTTEEDIIKACDLLWIQMRKLRQGVAEIESSLFMWPSRRRLALTETEQLAWVPRGTVIGDIIIIVPGSAVPFVLREIEKGCYRLVGEAYVHHAMFGESGKHTELDKLTPFKIV